MKQVQPVDNEFSREASVFDIKFEVPQRQRLLFTKNVFDSDVDQLKKLIEPSGPDPAKVQIWLDGSLEAVLGEPMGQLLSELQESWHINVVGEINTVPGGEQVKRDPTIIEGIWSAFNRDNLDRRSYVLVVGGGAVLDAVGYAAATAHRGIRLIRVPSTTLAQGDSGVGVKNAINYFDKKNWLGTFATPWAVVNDMKILESLPDRDFRCGFSEAVKVSLLKSPEQFEFLAENASRIKERDGDSCQQAIKDSILLHLHHITRGGDPFEAEIARPLDFGHWSAHKLEPMTNYKLRHGEAVSVGIALDCLYSSKVHGLSGEDALRIIKCLAEIGLPSAHSLLEDKTILFEGLEEFRQHLGGELTVTMLDGPGQPVDVHAVDYTAMGEAIDELLQLSTGENAIGRFSK